MIRVNNRQTIHDLARRFLRTNKSRNLIAVMAIVLTSILFTSVFTASFSVIKSIQQSEMRMVMDSAHIAAQDLTKKQYEQLITDSEIVRRGMNIFLTTAENEALNTIQTEIRYIDEIGAEGYLCAPTVGELPEEENELATSTKVLDALNVPHKLGEKVTLTYTLGEQQLVKEFTLSGYWKGDPISMAQMVWVSKKYCDQLSPMVAESDLRDGHGEGRYNASIWLSNSFHLEEKAEQLAERHGLENSNARISANPAYNLFEEDAFPFVGISIILLVIMLSGYLIIYNVFHISVNLDIHTYGLLKNVGTTGRQLKSIVRLQALQLSAIGIPLGLILGFFIGTWMTPFLLADGEEVVPSVLSVDPIIFLGAALFSLATVYIGCLRPCQIVGKLSPVEALRMTEVKSNQKARKSGSVAPAAMAWRHIGRTWKKAAAVVISLALSLIALNTVYMIVTGFDFNRFTSTLISADFELNKTTSNLKTSMLSSVTPTWKQALETNRDVESVGYVYFTKGIHRLADEAYEALEKETVEQIDTYNKEGKAEAQQALNTGDVTCHLIGINEAIFYKLNFYEGTPTWSEFLNGDYVIVSVYHNFYETGDPVTLRFPDGTDKSYTVLTPVHIPYTLDYPFYDGQCVQDFVVPEEDYIQGTGNTIAMTAAIDAKEGRMEAVGEWLTAYRDKHDQNFMINSRVEIKKQFNDFVNKYYMIGGMLTAVLFVIGMLNFLNTSATSILSRKKELSLLEVVGMTKKQIRKMLVVEGVLYILVAFLLAVTAGQVLAREIVAVTAGQAFFFQCELSILPSMLTLPLLLLIAGMVPVYYYRKMCQQTVVERIRDEG